MTGPTSVGRGARLEPLHVRHVAALATLAGAPDLAEEAEELARGQGAAWVTRSQAAAREGRELRFTVLAGDEVAGLVSLLALAPRTATLAYWIGAPHRGRGLATTAARQALGYAARRLAVEQVQARVRAGNAASARVLEKLGFRAAPGAADGPTRLVLDIGELRARPPARPAPG